MSGEQADDEAYRAALEHIRAWNESCRQADLEAGHTKNDIGREATLNYLRAHGRADLESVEFWLQLSTNGPK